jgi:hypothetical protein
MSDKIIGNFILELGGKPKENVEKAIDLIEKKLKEEYKVINIEKDEIDYDEKTTLYHGLIEVKIKFGSIQKLLDFIIDYTPTSTEIEEPEIIEIENNSLTELLNHLSNNIIENTNEVRKLRATVHYLNDLLNKNKKN